MARRWNGWIFGDSMAVWLSLAGSALAGPEAAVGELAKRLLPNRAGEFVFESIEREGGQDVFEIESADGKIVVRGSGGIAMASGLNWYLKHHCRCQVSFNGDQLDLPPTLPVVSPKIRRVSPFRYRYCFNYCAFSYTMAWWDWPQWQRMIDWMALHGINMPLAMTGQEAVWQKAYRDMGLSDEEIGRFFVGPGYLPFGWMGCIDEWAGPLPQSWIDRHRELQKKIVDRQRQLGMTPVLQGFTGHVPEALGKKFPEAKLQQLPSWCGFPGTHFVDPRDPLFARVGKAFIEEQTRQFGTDHLYASDTFIEMSPPSNDPAFLSAMGGAVFAAMAAGDPEAKWVMQGWLFCNNPGFWKPPQTKALLDAVPDERMIVLDLFCEATPTWPITEAFHGKPWVFCVLHNFGGKVGMYGGLPQIAANLDAAVRGPDRGKLSGLGLTMEGFGYNPIVYDFVTDMTWRGEVPPLDDWAGEFVHRRYGRRVPRAEEAWDILRRTVYRQPGNPGSILCARPAIGKPCTIGYDSLELLEAWEKLTACADELGDVDTYRFDLVHLTRQALSNLGEVLYTDVVDAYQAKDPRALAEASRRLLELIGDLDQLLATREDFLLGRWLEDAKRWATNDEEKRLYEHNARTIITLWGPPDGVLHEYAQRQWSGLLRGFYRPRWEMFLARLEKSLAEGKPLDAAAWEQDIRRWENEWTRKTESYPTAVEGKPIETSRRLLEKHRQAYRKAFGPDAESLTTGKPTSCSSSLPEYPARLAADGRRGGTNQY
ncbi:MAG: alpha-N-acetylglucosaminidase [Planctomycetia bacterium]|nr:alpha-N-acetylglucosaminidase [Planctomycetia bacterium]